jgi:EmrB/QacA subfamily drug resistance transporter
MVGGVEAVVGTAASPDDLVRMGTPQGRWVLTATILASGMAFLDSTVVNVALRAIGNDLDADLGDLQWVISAYMLTLASLILVAGSLGDMFGRRRVFLVGVIWFAVASVLCGLAPNPMVLIVARALQGVGGALLTPGSLAILQSGFRPEDRAQAIGAWSGLAGVSMAVGPFLGGWLLLEASWRWIFLINVPLAAVVVFVTLRHVPGSCNRNASTRPRLDTVGAVLGSLGLAGLTFALIEAGSGVGLVVAAAGAAGVLTLVAFVVSQRRSTNPMVPPRLFASRTFTTTNALTLVVYAALGVMSFFLVLQLQVGLGWTPLAAGASMLPTTVLMMLFSSQAGALGQRVGPRLPLTVGPLLAAVGVGWLVGVGRGDDYLTDILPALVVFGVGLTIMVAPLTATVLAAAPDAMAGVASGVNNAVARTGSLLAVAALPLAVGLSGADYESASAFGAGYRDAMIVCAAMLVLGGLAALFGLPSAARTTTGHRTELQPETSSG